MGYWNEQGLLRKDDSKCFQRAILEVRTKTGTQDIEFKYRTIAEETITDTESSIPMTYDKKSKGIFVFEHWLPFVNGARVYFDKSKKTSMTVSGTAEVVDEEKAQFDGNGIIGLNVYFGG